MKTLLVLTVVFLLDVSPDPLHSTPWGSLIVLLAIIFVLAVSFAASLVFVLIRLKRRRKPGSP
jgi:uncharacterized protein (DUF58 family)